MEQIIEIGDNRYMLGLQWLQIQGKDPLLDAKTKAKSAKTHYGIIRGIDRGDGTSGFQVAMTAKKSKGVVYVGSAHLSNIHPSVIGIEQIDEELFWICVADTGRILPGYDAVSTDSEVKMLLSELASEYELDYMTMVMNEEVAAKFGISNHIGTSPFELFAKHDPDDSIKIKSLIGVPYTFYLGGLIIALSVGMGGFWANEKYKEKREMERMIALAEAERLENERLKRESEKVDSEAEILAAALEEEKAWVRDEFNKLRLTPLMKQVYLLNENLPERFMGWRLEGIFFSSSLPDDIVSMWVNDGGLVASLNRLFDGTGSKPSLSPDMKTARVGHKISLGSEGIKDIVTHIRENGTSHKDLADILISGNIQYSTSIKEIGDRKEPIKGLADEHLANMPQLRLRQRSFEMKTDSKESFAQLIKRLERTKNYLPELIHVERDGMQTKWVINGTLYEE